MKRNKLCYRILAAMTLDGRIALNKNHFSNWTSKEDKKFLHKMLAKSDVVIIGHNTYKVAYKSLVKRNCIVFTRSVKNIKQKNKNCLYLNPTNVDLEQIIRARGYKNIDILGGTQIYSWFLKRNLFNDIYLTIEPIIFGSGFPLFNVKVKQKKYNLKLIKKLNKKGSILLHYTKI